LVAALQKQILGAFGAGAYFFEVIQADFMAIKDKLS
jgi:hypothetical protein